jgi:hypothetical protein
MGLGGKVGGGIGSGMGSKGDSQTVRISMVAPNVLSWSSPLLSMNEKQMTSSLTRISC